MTVPVLFNWLKGLINLLGVTVLAMAFLYMYATESGKKQ